MRRQQFSVSGFVLVGGESRRMGCDKGLLQLHGAPLLLRAARSLSVYVDSVTLLGSPDRYSQFDLPVLADEVTLAGPLAALATALKHSGSDWNLFLACDLPLVSRSVIERLVGQIAETHAQALVPRTASGWQPLCAAYHRSCLSVMEQSLARRELSVVGLFPSLCVQEINASPSEDARSWDQMFSNINTIEEWEQVRRELEER